MTEADRYDELLLSLGANPKRWLITGVAGFIGSNLLETLLLNDQWVVGLDNFATGSKLNLDTVRLIVGDKWQKFTLIEGDIRDIDVCRSACFGVDYVLHQAALGSVPRSINDPLLTNSTNIDGFLSMLVAAKDFGVESFTYAASSSTYGDHPGLPKVEDVIGNPLSPYAVTKHVNELYADVFSRTYNFKSIGLRYFNVFGKRQDPNGPYAAVIPKWAAAMIGSKPVEINGDGETSRDFCYIKNVVQANLLAATAKDDAKNQVYNIAVGDRTTLNELFLAIKKILISHHAHLTDFVPTYRDFRVGDVRHSLADISKAQRLLGYKPTHRVQDGLLEAMDWYVGRQKDNISLKARKCVE